MGVGVGLGVGFIGVAVVPVELGAVVSVDVVMVGGVAFTNESTWFELAVVAG